MGERTKERNSQQKLGCTTVPDATIYNKATATEESMHLPRNHRQESPTQPQSTY